MEWITEIGFRALIENGKMPKIWEHLLTIKSIQKQWVDIDGDGTGQWSINRADMWKYLDLMTKLDVEKMEKHSAYIYYIGKMDRIIKQMEEDDPNDAKIPMVKAELKAFEPGGELLKSSIGPSATVTREMLINFGHKLDATRVSFQANINCANVCEEIAAIKSGLTYPDTKTQLKAAEIILNVSRKAH